MPIVLRSQVRSNLRALGRKFQKLNKEALLDLGDFWHREIAAGHFFRSAKNTYHYQRRKRATDFIKKRMGWNPGVDLMRKGRSKRELLSGRRIKATATRGTVRMKVPVYWSKSSEKGGRPHKADEVIRVSDRDRKLMSGRLDRMLEYFIDREKKRLAAETL